MKVCETLTIKEEVIDRCFEYQLIPELTADGRDTLLLITLSIFMSVFLVKIAQKMFFAV